jgi:hypothetical protein
VRLDDPDDPLSAEPLLTRAPLSTDGSHYLVEGNSGEQVGMTEADSIHRLPVAVPNSNVLISAHHKGGSSRGMLVVLGRQAGRSAPAHRADAPASIVVSEDGSELREIERPA